MTFFACRGYNSQSEQWRAGKRLQRARRSGKEVHILHLGDHDPSGIDMTRDNDDRLRLLSHGWVHVNRLALNMDQVEEYNPPENPTKLSDARAGDYVAAYGYSSWELDALEPRVISDLIRGAVAALRDDIEWERAEADEERQRNQLVRVRDLLREENEEDYDDDEI